MKLKFIRFTTLYWKPGTNFIEEIIKAISHHVKDDDIIILSEKAIATALGHIIDEQHVKPGKVAQFLAFIVTRKLWGGPLGRITKLKEQTLNNLRNYPQEGASHKQVTLSQVGIFQSLRHYSEGGIDASNLPYSLVSLPLNEPEKIATKIRNSITHELERKTTIIIADGDTTYSWKNLHLAPRKVLTPGLIHLGGVFTFIIGRILKLKTRQTPIVISGDSINPDRALWFTWLYHKYCGKGAGRTVWSMSKKFNTTITSVTWEMLENVEHNPIAIIRILNNTKKD